MSMRRAFLAAVIALPLSSSSSSSAATSGPPFVSLFDGKTLAGLSPRGDAGRFSVKEGVLVAAGGPTNASLCTERAYGDFVLEYEVRPAEADTSVVLRAPPATASEPAAIRPTIPGGLLRPGTWTNVRIETDGDAVTVTVAGRPPFRNEGAQALEGFVCLMAPSSRDATTSFRKLRLQERGRHLWMPLLSPALTGIQRTGGGRWDLVAGVLTGIGTSDGKPGLLYVDRPVTDFTARLEYRLSGGNAGLYLHARAGEDPSRAQGLQVDIDPTEAGGLYDAGGRGWLVANLPVVTAQTWHSLVVNVRGPHVAVYLDGARTAQVEDAPGPARGYLGLELAGGPNARFEVRRLDRLSPLVRPPLAGLPVGHCVSKVDARAAEDAKAAGFEYLEIALQDLVSLDAAAFGREVTRLRALPLPVTAGYAFLPPDTSIVGPKVDTARVDEAVVVGLERAAKLGITTVVFGHHNGASRSFPAGFPPDQAWKQLTDFARRSAAVADRLGITILVEPLPTAQSNTINTIAEGLRLVREVNRPRVQLMVDYAYLIESKESLAVLEEAARYVRLVEVSNPLTREFPRSPDEADYASFFRALARGGFTGAISVHARPAVFMADAPAAIAILRELLNASAKRR